MKTGMGFMTAEVPQNIKERILSEAGPLFIKGGYNGLAMREIAEAVGITKPALYYHFKDKDDLILAMLVSCLEEYLLLLEKSLASASSTREKLRCVVTAILLLPAEKRAMIPLAEHEIGHLSQPSRDQFNQLYRDRFQNKIKQICEAGIESGELREMDARVLSHIFLGMIFPLFHYPAEQVQPFSELTLSIFFNGASRNA
jgi:AcrR family transcriptional regulator